ncbi:hypothetical protein BDY17DRAFT_291346 [Neohortaea acidophila]|uniref:DSC E3 ubiquitin ligase complex subunit A n=1 Tax=Neohortaea acidophila TaxID=245834 RepID=A0A6A6Q1T7_9PEZI|nr:uncharacterized protein BDY17DRAFT_291346 [Neohortaea acidophila]KAF2486360.1 hypothetical protein BDY17DRAFT_291346 [Neohortaea acidophila]
MADRRGIFVPLIILAFIFLSPDPARPATRQLRIGRTLDDVIVEEQRSLAVLQNSSYASHALPQLNLTGLEDARGYAWDALPAVRQRGREQLEYALGPFAGDALGLKDDTGSSASPAPLYHNITGFVHGTWVRSKVDPDLPRPHLNLSDYEITGPFGLISPRAFDRNVTGEEGDVRLRFHKHRPPADELAKHDDFGNVTSLVADLTITDDDSSEYSARLFGVYFLHAGQAILTTTSDKFAGIFLLPHLAMSERMFAASRGLLNDTISKTLQRQVDGRSESFNPWSSSTQEAPVNRVSFPECEIIVYLQQHPPTSTSRAAPDASVLSVLEKELRFPTGAYVPPAPDMKFSMTAFSPDCGYVLESKGPPGYAIQDGAHFTGPKMEVLNNSSRKHDLVFTLVLLLQIFLLKRQMHEASTPSTRSRISLYTVAMLALGDGFTFMTFLLVSFFIGGLFVTIMATAFLSFVCVSFFGMRFLMDIWLVQAPERARRRREEAEEWQRREEIYREALERVRERRAQDPALNGGNAASNGGSANPVTPAQDINITPAPSIPQEDVPPVADPAVTATPDQAPPPNPAPVDSLPPPVTMQRPTDTGAAPVFMPSDQVDLEQWAPAPGAAGQAQMVYRESFGSVYTRFYLLLLAILFMSLNAMGWPSGLRRVYFTTLGVIYLSFWIPQINRNVQRNCRKALKWEFVLGQSFVRCLPFAYFYTYKRNVVFSDVDYTSLAILVVWLWVQILVLASQELIGPRWFVGKNWAPPAYDYHPVLREDVEGSTMPMGFSEAAAAAASTPSSPIAEREGGSLSRRASLAAKESRERGKRVYDCAICMQELEVPVIESGSSSESMSGPTGLLARRMYMVTPCRHIFHSGCLEGWMKYRLQCPICRETLPPL